MSSNTNFATWNPLTIGTRSGLTNGNTTLSSISAADLAGGDATMGITTGKYYWEIYIHDNGSGYIWSGLSSGYEGGGFYSGYSDVNGMTPGAIRLRNNGTLDDSSAQDDPDRWGTITLTSTGVSSYTDGDVMMYALDYDNKKLWIGKNGTFFNSGNPAAGSNQQASWNGDVPIIYPNIAPYYPGSPNNGGTVNFGQDSSFAGNKTSGSAAATDGNGYGDFYYTPPTDYLAVCSANVPTSDDIDPAQTDDNIPTKNFGVVTWTGNSSTNNITGLGFQPDLVWTKGRSTTYDNRLWDSSRGVQKYLIANSNAAEATLSTGLTSFDSDGFTLGSGGSQNNNGSTYVAWCWKFAGGTTATNNDGNTTTTVQANQAAGQSIVQWTGNATNSTTLGHGLTKKPNFVIVKRTENTQSWNTWGQFNNNGSATGEYGYLFLESTGAYANGSGALKYWYPSGMTTTTIGIGGASGNNNNGEDMIIYCFHDVEGYSKFGSYAGNGNANGPFVYTGFRPRLLMIRNTEQSSNWGVYDSARQTFNANENYLRWNSNAAEGGGGGSANAFDVDFLSNGFKVRSTETDLNTSGKQFIYTAWGDVPFKYNNTF